MAPGLALGCELFWLRAAAAYSAAVAAP